MTRSHDRESATPRPRPEAGPPAAPEGDASPAVLQVYGMDCPDCAATLERALRRVAGVRSARVSFASSRAILVADPAALDVARREARALGYGLAEAPAGGVLWGGRWRPTLTAAALLAAGWVFSRLPAQGAAATASMAAYLTCVAVGGFPIFRSAALALRSGQLTVNALVSLAVAGALASGEAIAACEVVVLMGVGEALQDLTLERTRRAVRGLLDLAPRAATVLREDQELQVSPEEIAQGDLVVVRPGERIAADGSVVEGRADVSEAPITGESRLRAKAAGDAAFAGSLVVDGSLLLRAEKVGRQTALARVVQLIEEAETTQAPVARLVDRFSRLFVPLSILAAVAVLVLTRDPRRAVTILVGACPCALVLSTPVAVFAAIGSASRRGLLIKGGLYLERLGSLKVMAFDKTGTLTAGEFEVLDVVAAPCPERAAPGATAGDGAAPAEIGRRACLELAAAVERNSEHPIGRAIATAAGKQGLQVRAVTDFASFPGRGVEGTVTGLRVQVVGRRGLGEAELTMPAELAAAAEKSDGLGLSVVYVLVDGRLCGLVVLGDAVRSEARHAISGLLERGVTPVLLSGDDRGAVMRVADMLGIADHRGGLLPEAKVSVVRELDRAWRGVAMVGDGVNDAPALKASSVGIAMGRHGTDLAIETADVVLLADDLTRLVELVDLGRRALRIIRLNLVISAAAICGLFVAAATGAVGPAVGALVHEGSSLAVTLNAMRLLRSHPQEPSRHGMEHMAHEATAGHGVGCGHGQGAGCGHGQ